MISPTESTPTRATLALRAQEQGELTDSTTTRARKAVDGVREGGS